MGANFYFVCNGICGGGTVDCPVCITLSCEVLPFPGRKNKLIAKIKTKISVAKIVVDFVKISDARRIPNIVPICPPPSDPANPPPFELCKRITIINKIEKIIINTISKLYIFVFLIFS